LDRGCDVNANAKDDIFDTSSTNGSALASAAYNGNYQIVQMLLDNGADVNAVVQGDISNNTLYAVSACSAQFDIALLLLSNEARVDLHTDGADRALHGASSNGETQIVGLFLDYGADINAVGLGHETPLGLASQ